MLCMIAVNSALNSYKVVMERGAFRIVPRWSIAGGYLTLFLGISMTKAERCAGCSLLYDHYRVYYFKCVNQYGSSSI